MLLLVGTPGNAAPIESQCEWSTRRSVRGQRSSSAPGREAPDAWRSQFDRGCV